MGHLAKDERGTAFVVVRSIYIGFAALNGILVGAAETLRGGVAIAVLVGSLLVPVVVLLGSREMMGALEDPT